MTLGDDMEKIEKDERCPFCGGGDVHTATCWTQSVQGGSESRQRV